MLLVIVHCTPDSLGSFTDGFILLINKLPAQHRILIVGNFNLYQMIPENVAKADPLIYHFNLSQRLQYSAHT